MYRILERAKDTSPVEKNIIWICLSKFETVTLIRKFDEKQRLTSSWDTPFLFVSFSIRKRLNYLETIPSMQRLYTWSFLDEFVKAWKQFKSYILKTCKHVIPVPICTDTIQQITSMLIRCCKIRHSFKILKEVKRKLVIHFFR